MSVAAVVDLELDQGADFAVQLYWLDPALTPYTVLAPMKMEIRTLGNNQVAHTLTSTASNGITFNSDGGLIQLVIPASITTSLKPDTYVYDLFVTYRENPTTTRVRRLIKGNLIVNKKVTASL